MTNIYYRKGKPKPWSVQWRDGRKRKTASFSKKRDAETHLEQCRRLEELRAVGLNLPDASTIFIDYAKKWLAKRFATLPAGTVEQDNSKLRNYWLPRLGDKPISGITTKQIRDHLEELRGSVSVATINRHRALLHKLFHDALSDELVRFNPVSAIKLESEPIQKRTMVTEVDQQRYLAEIAKEGEAYWILAMIMLWTGARIMSASALQWGDISGGVVVISRIIERATGRLVERTKGKGLGGKEIVPLFPPLADALSELKNREGFIAQIDGEHITYEQFKRAHRRAIERLGITFTPHDLRRAFATNAKRAGYTRSEIREMLGHSSDAVTGRYDLDDIEHLVEKGKRIGFGATKILKIKSSS